MTALDEILYNAIMADDDIKDAVKNTDARGTVTGYRIVSTCFEVGPDEQDNTPLPYVIVTDDGAENGEGTKDDVWESSEDTVQASIEVGADSPRAVKSLIRMCRHAVAAEVARMAARGEEIPQLVSVQLNGVGWDWMKPCYHETITYQCITPNSYE